MKRKIISILTVLVITGCSIPAINTTQDFTELEKEYKSFSTKALSNAYVKRMFGKYLGGTPNSLQLTRQLEFSRYLKNHGDITYETSLKNMFVQTPTLYDAMTGTSSPDIQNKMSTESATFGTFVRGLSPYPGTPVATGATGITPSSFTANWNPTTNATEYKLYVNGNQVYSGTNTTFNVASLTANTTYTYNIKAINSAGESQSSNTVSVSTLSSIVTSGLVLNFDAGDTSSYSGSGTIWNDLSGRGNNGTFINGPSYSSSNQGIIVFDGVNDRISVPSTSDFNFSSVDFTIEGVVFYDSSTSSDNLYGNTFAIGTSSSSNYLSLTKWRSGLANGFNLDYTVSGNRYLITTSDIIGNPNVLNTSGPIYDVTNKWTHYCIRVSSNVMSLYINGAFSASVNLLERWDQNQNLTLGSDDNSYYLKGKLPIFRVYKGLALTNAEILQNFNQIKSRYGL